MLLLLAATAQAAVQGLVVVMQQGMREKRAA
jgi:hypothetical protein